MSTGGQKGHELCWHGSVTLAGGHCLAEYCLWYGTCMLIKFYIQDSFSWIIWSGQSRVPAANCTFLTAMLTWGYKQALLSSPCSRFFILFYYVLSTEYFSTGRGGCFDISGTNTIQITLFCYRHQNLVTFCVQTGFLGGDVWSMLLKHKQLPKQNTM